MSVKIPTNVWDLDLPTSEKLLLLAVAHHFQQSGLDSLPDRASLETLSDYGRRTIRRVLRSLEAKGFIKHQEAR